MQQYGFSKWLSHPVYFLFWFLAGLWALSFSFEPQVKQLTQVTNLSSLELTVDLSETNYLELQALPDDELLQQLEKNSYLQSEDPYALNPQEIEKIDHTLFDGISYTSHLLYEPIAEDSIKGEYENPKDSKECSPARLFYERQIRSNPQLKELATDRGVNDSQTLPKKCLLHVMNRTSLAKSNYGMCTKASGMVHIPGVKPCITESLVNLTYNSFIDVMDCLNLNPKLFFPKIANESGFLLNAYGVGKDGGIGQFTQSAIDGVNHDYDKYFNEIEKAAVIKPSCARIMKFKSMLKKASGLPGQRCSMIALPENPLRNILYIGIFNKSNMDRFSGMKYIAGEDFFEHNSNLVPATYDSRDEFEGIAKINKYKELLEDLGIKNPNMHFFKEVLTIASYNMGSPTALRLFSKYLQKRKLAKRPLTMADFNFNDTRTAKDIYGDGKEKNVIEIARSFIMSSFISPKDKAEVKMMKLKKRKQLPKIWAMSFLKTFPEFLTLNANSYDGKQITGYSIYGVPGYVSYVADKNRELRNVFNSAGVNPDFCSDPNFLVFKDE